MISKPTVFILGAGASKPYGYPLGWELRERILALPDDCELFPKLDHAPNEFIQFKKALAESPAESIDAFLEHRDEFTRIGKHAIAAELLKCEQRERLYDPGNEDDWYRYLFNRMTAGVRFDHFLQNEVSFVTFNYDRSLEEYLFNR